MTGDWCAQVIEGKGDGNFAEVVTGLFLGGGFGALFGVAGRGDETAAGGPRSMGRYSGATDPALPGVPVGLVSRRWCQEAQLT